MIKVGTFKMPSIIVLTGGQWNNEDDQFAVDYSEVPALIDTLKKQYENWLTNQEERLRSQ